MEMSDRTKERDVQHAEYKFFYTYFSYLGSFMCDKAKEFAEKERATFLPANLQVALVHLAQHEKVYFSLSFLEQKSWFARRDSLKNSYSTLQSMFLSTEKQELKINLVETESNVEQESLISAICLQLSDFCAARLECLSLYIQMYKSTLASPLHTLCSEVQVLLESYPAKISHDCLKRIQDCVTEELTVLLALLQAGQKISEWNYTGALYDMDEAHEVLVRWKPLVMNNQGSTFRGSFFSFGEKSSTPASGLYLWMEKFFQTLKSRFTFYFYEALSTSGSADELKQILSRVKYDFVTKSMSHIKRNDFQQLLLVLDTRGNDMPPQVGYSFPTLTDSPPAESSAGDYSVVLNLPPSTTCNVQPVFSLINDKMDELKQEKIVYYSSVETSKTYFCAQADQKIFIVLVCGGYRNEKDSNLIVYFNEVLNNLKLKKIALLLKPGNR